MAEQHKRGNRWLVVVGVLLLVVAGGCVAVTVWGFVGSIGGLPPPLLMPGTHSVQISEPGPQMISYESQSVVGGQAFISPGQPTDIQVTVVGPDGAPVAVQPYGASYSYTVRGRSGQGLFEFAADRPGQYEVTAQAMGASQQFVLAVGPQRLWAMLLRVFAGVCGTFVFVAAGAVFLIIALVRHVRGRRLAAVPPQTPCPGTPT